MIEKNKLLNFIKSKKSVSFLEIVKHFKISPAHNKEITILINSLIKSFDIFKNRNDQYYIPKFLKEEIGILNINSSGRFGFVSKDQEDVEEEYREDDIFVSKFNFNGAMNKDVVSVKVFQEITKDNETKTYGIITKIIERTNVTLIGFIKKNGQYVDFEPLDKSYRVSRFRIHDLKVKASINDLVVAKITKYDSKNVYIDIVEVITNKTDPKVFLKAFIEQNKLAKGFPDTLDEELTLIPDTIDNENFDNRHDLREELIVTIDGESTKDFDDAINVKKLQNGNYLLGVHIADVSYYVKEDSQIDKEALQRGTSIYLVDRVIPMLPEKLSNGICSLNPNVDRFTLSCSMEIDQQGNTVSTKVFPSIINSKYRLTYKQVNEFLDGKNTSIADDKNLKNMLILAKELSVIIHQYKINEGYIDFEISEPKIILNDDGSVKDIVVTERGCSEVLIEDFMVRANEEVAKFLFKKHLPVMYRVHDIPDEEKIANLKMVLNTLNIQTKFPLEMNPKAFSKLTEEIKTQKDDEFIKLLFLRTMQKAKYSSFNIGHFGLASEFYCHFTSPIRRYPDLIIHRLLRELVFKNNKKSLLHFENILEDISAKNSASEQSSVEIERNSNDLMYAEYFKNKIGQKYKAQIISIVKFGFFVEFPNKTDALVHHSTLLDAEYQPNENLTELISPKRKFKLGDYVDVIVSGVDLVEGKVDCVLEEFYEDFLKKENTHKNVNKANIRKH